MKIIVDMRRTPDYDFKNELYDLDYGYNREGEVIYDLADANIFECIAACLDAMTLEKYPLETINKIKDYITDLEWPEE